MTFLVHMMEGHKQAMILTLNKSCKFWREQNKLKIVQETTSSFS